MFAESYETRITKDSHARGYHADAHCQTCPLCAVPTTGPARIWRRLFIGCENREHEICVGVIPHNRELYGTYEVCTCHCHDQH